MVQARSFAERLEESIRRYQNRSIEAAQIIAELIELAKEMREARERGKILGLTDDEEAFYDALEVNDSAVKVLGDETLKTIASSARRRNRRGAHDYSVSSPPSTRRPASVGRLFFVDPHVLRRL